MTRPPPNLPDAELDVIAWLWRSGPATARQVREGVSGRRPMTDGATVTLLKRLEAKGLVTRAKRRGSPYLYTPARRPDPIYRKLVRALADRLFGGDSAQLVISLFEGRPPTDEELDKIERAIEDLKRKKKITTEAQRHRERQ
jgi:BlaI family transcriptional regulator, penicillinase repressor